MTIPAAGATPIRMSSCGASARACRPLHPPRLQRRLAGGGQPRHLPKHRPDRNLGPGRLPGWRRDGARPRPGSGYLPGPAKRVEHWREVVDRIRESCPDIIINNTTGRRWSGSHRRGAACVSAGAAGYGVPQPGAGYEPVRAEGTRRAAAASRAPVRGPTTAGRCHTSWCSVCERDEKAWYQTGAGDVTDPGGAWVIRALIDQELVESPTGFRR